MSKVWTMTWLVIIVLALVLPEVLSIVLESRLGRALAARVEARTGEETRDSVMERVRYLEGEVDRLSEEARRLSEQNDFLQKVLSDPDRRDEKGSRLSPGDGAP
jgi:hypothetical protein